MLNKLIFGLVLLLAAVTAGASPVVVRMTTAEGSIDIELYADRAPRTVANFLRYVDAGHFDGASFYRTVTRANDKGKPVIEVIQGGLGDVEPPFPPIAHESTKDTGLKHEDGTISMARGDVGTAAGEFFICIGPQPGLDYGAMRNPDGQGFAAFGKVIRGMDVVRRIHGMPADGEADSAYVEGQILSEPVRIETVRRLDESSRQAVEKRGFSAACDRCRDAPTFSMAVSH